MRGFSMKNGKPRVVFTYVEAGFGHIAPMISIEKAFREKFGESCEVFSLYPFNADNADIRGMGNELSSHTKRTGRNPSFRKLERLSYILPSKFILWCLDKHFGTKREVYLKYYRSLKPDLIVSSYYLPSHLATISNQRGEWDTLIASYSPDYCTYPAWDRDCDAYFVFNEEAEKSCLKKGFKPRQVQRVPFVYKEGVETARLEREELKQKFGVDNGNLTVLFTSGAYGSKNTLKCVKKVCQNLSNINLLVGCGKDQNLLQKTSALAEDNIKNDGIKRGVKIIPIAFTENLLEYMACADVCVGKASPNTIEESLFVNTPFIMNAVTTAVEEYSLKHYKKKGLCIKAFSVRKLLKALQNLQGDRLFYQNTLDTYAKFKSSGGAEAVADKLYELLKTRFNNL